MKLVQSDVTAWRESGLREFRHRRNGAETGDEGMFQGRVTAMRQGGISREHGGGVVAGEFKHIQVVHQVRDTQFRQAMLSATEQLARASEFQVLLGDAEPILGGAKDSKARERVFLAAVRY